MFPSIEDTDEKLIAELVDGGRSVAQAGRVLEELGRACTEAAAELEALIQVSVFVLGGDFDEFFFKTLWMLLAPVRERTGKREQHTHASGCHMKPLPIARLWRAV